jgi:hypothetical protein
MSTAAQVIANRANAQLSTGPRSVEGKAASSRNALKFGIYAKSLVIPGEEPAELEQLARDYEAEMHPEGPVEAALVDTMVRSDWMQRRLARIEAEVIAARLAARENPGEHPLGDIYIEDGASGKLFESLARRQQALQRDYFRALKEFRELKQCRMDNAMFAAMRRAQPAPRLAAAPAENRVRSSMPAPIPHPAERESLGNPALRL